MWLAIISWKNGIVCYAIGSTVGNGYLKRERRSSYFIQTDIKQVHVIKEGKSKLIAAKLSAKDERISNILASFQILNFKYFNYLVRKQYLKFKQRLQYQAFRHSPKNRPKRKNKR